MPRLAPGQISKHPRKGYRVSVGTYVKNGQVREKVFWLAHNEEHARYAAHTYRKAWANRPKDQQHWTDEAIRNVRQGIADSVEVMATVFKSQDERAVRMEPMRALTVPGTTAVASPVSTTAQGEHAAPTLATARQEFQEHMKRKVPHQLSQPRYNRLCVALKLIDDVIPPATPLHEIRKPELEKLVSHFTARPVREHTGNPMAARGVTTTVQAFRQFFDWLDGDKWEGPRRMDKVFKLRTTALMTAAEQRKAANGNAVFTTAELKELYTTANENQRLYMLLALNTASTQKELATLALDEIDLSAGVIDRIRHKTRSTAIRGRWQLWPETLELLKARIATTPRDPKVNPAGLAMLTDNDRPLVHDETDTDTIASTWARLIRRTNKEEQKVRRLGFKTLRKTAADAILRISGSEAVQQLMLAHARRTMAARHYTGETHFEPLAQPLKHLGDELQAAGVFKTREKKKAAKTKAA